MLEATQLVAQHNVSLYSWTDRHQRSRITLAFEPVRSHLALTVLVR